MGERDGELEKVRQEHGAMQSRLDAREVDVLEASLNIKRLQKELEDCKHVMYRAIGCDPSLSESPKSLAVSEALLQEAQSSKRQLVDTLKANQELQRQLSDAHAQLNALRSAAKSQ